MVHDQGMDEPRRVEIDVVIFGGGVAGLWILSTLRNAGYDALLLDPNDLGSGQTACSQGKIGRASCRERVSFTV